VAAEGDAGGGGADLGGGGAIDNRYMECAIFHRLGELLRMKSMVNIVRSLFKNGVRPRVKANRNGEPTLYFFIQETRMLMSMDISTICNMHTTYGILRTSQLAVCYMHTAYEKRYVI